MARAPERKRWTARFDHPVGVLLVSLHVLKFGRELDPHQSPRERAPRGTIAVLEIDAHARPFGSIHVFRVLL